MTGSNCCDTSHNHRFHQPWLPLSHINEYHTGVARFQHAVSYRRSVRRQPFALMSLFFVAPDAYSRSFSEFFSVANVNSFLSLKRIKITSFGNETLLSRRVLHGDLFQSVVQKSSLLTLQTTVMVIK